MNTVRALTLVGILSGTASAAGLAQPEVRKNVDPKLEQKDRSVDQVALQSQQRALSRLQDLLKKYRGQESEPGLLARLAEAWQQDAAIRFRIAHGRAHRQGQTLDLEPFKKSMKASVNALNEVIHRFPGYPDMHECYFLRAKAYDEMSDVAAAKRDYQELVKRFPEAVQATAAHMRLAEYAIDDNQHEEAVRHLVEIEKKPEDSQYPFALYKLAWSHYNLKHTGESLRYLEKHIAYYRESTEPQASDAAILETSLMDLTLFFYDGFEKKVDGYDSSRALGYFRKIEKGPFLGRMLARYARLLRAGSFDQELNNWKNLVLKEEMDRGESLEVALAPFEDKVNKRAYLKLGPDARDIVRVYRESKAARASENAVAARKQLIDTSETLRTLTIKNKKATEVGALANALEELTLALTDILEEKDPLAAKARFNLAETYFEVGNYAKATEYYRWIVNNWKDAKSFDPDPAALRAIAARYETLKSRNIIPSSLSARVQPKEAPKPDPALTEWLVWIDAYKGKDSDARKTFLNYSFEANRALYASGDVKGASERLLQFVDQAPESEFAIPSASLVLDTRILGEEWQSAYDLIRDFRKVSAWNGTPFAERLGKLEADSYYKLLELAYKKQDWSEVESLSKSCVKKYAQSERVSDCRLIGAKALLARGEEKEAGESINKLIESAPKTDAAAWGLLSRGKLREKSLDISHAAEDYRTYSLTSGEASLKERALLLTWISDNGKLREFWKDAHVCGAKNTGTLNEACLRYGALMELQGAEGLSLTDSPPAGVIALQSLRRLQNKVPMDPEERAKQLALLAKNWERLDSLTQFAVLPELPDVIHRSLSEMRQWASEGAALQPNKKSIKKRLERISTMEDVAAQVVKLPWARLRVDALNETAEAYAELAVQLRAIPAPKDLPSTELESYNQVLAELAMPFEEKSQDIRKKAFDLAADKRVERAMFEQVSRVFFKDNPSQAKKLSALDDANRNLPRLELGTLVTYDPEGSWSQVEKIPTRWDANNPQEKARVLRGLWWTSMKKKQFPLAAWYLREAREGKLLGSQSLALMQALILQEVGARSEALALLGDLKPIQGQQPLLGNAPIPVAAQGRGAGL